MDGSKYLAATIAMFVFIISLGTAGYMIIEHWPLLDAVYMTVITITTVGYGEVHQVSGVGRLFTMLLLFLGAGFYVYFAGTMIRFMVEGRIRALLGRRRLDRKINRIKNHYIVCGYGRIGRLLCKQLTERTPHLVVIEKDASLIPTMESDGMLYLIGDASDEEVLHKAGIKRGKVLVAALATDADNVFLVLTARQLNPMIFIMARSARRESKNKLYAAGANQVESPYDIGAVSMAHRLLRPTVTNFMDLAFTYKRQAIQMEEIPVDPRSPMVNVMLKDSGIRQKYDLIIIAIKKADGGMLFNPSFETVIKGGDTVIAVGEGENLVSLEKVLNPLKSESEEIQ